MCIQYRIVIYHTEWYGTMVLMIFPTYNHHRHDVVTEGEGYIHMSMCHHDNAIARVHSVHLTNRQQQQTEVQPKPTHSGCERACIHHASPFVIYSD